MLTTAFLAMAEAVSAQLPASVAPATPASKQQPRTLRLTTADMFRLAETASANGDGKTALAIYAALEENPDSDVRAEARFRHARQLMQHNRHRDAAVLLRRILDEKPKAAGVRLELAHVQHLLGNSDAALRELRAARAAGLPAAVARLVDRYSEALRASRPMGASLQVAVASDSNFNHATRSDTLGTIFGDFDIDEDSKARSGLGISVRGQAYRRIMLKNSDHNLLIRAGGSADVYGKSSFNDIAAELAGGPEVRIARNRMNLELGATQRWFGQKPFMRTARLAASWTRPFGSRTQLRISGSGALVDNQFNDLQDGKAYSAQVDLERALSATTGVVINVGGDRHSSKDPGYSTTGRRAGLLGWHDVGRATLTAGAEIGSLQADERLLLFPEKRSDRYSRLTFGTTFRQLTFKGFAPLARLTIERNRSTIAFYDFQRTRTEFAIVRAF